MIIQSFTNAFLFGLIGGAIPGPVLTAIFTEILQSSFVKSLRVIFQAMFTETLIALLSLVLLSSLGLSESFFKGLSLVGAGILLWIASSIWKVKTIDTKEQVHFGFWKISSMILANGVLWTFWVTVAVPRAIEINSLIPFGSFLFLVFVEIGWLCSTVFIAFIFSRFRALLSKPKVIPIIFKVFAGTFVYFALNLIYTSTRYFMGW